MREFKPAIWLGAVLALFLFSGCESFQELLDEALDPEAEVTDNPNSDDFKRRYVVSVHAVVTYPRAGDLEREVRSDSGKSVWINVNQIISSKNIKGAKAVPRPGSPDLYDIELKLDRFGKLQWQILSGNHGHEAVVLMIDGVYFGDFYPELPGNDRPDWVTLRVGIDPVTAKGVANYARKNYINLNPDSRNWF